MSCCVPLCTRNQRNKTPGLKFYRFPVDEKECKKWLKLIRRENFEWSMSTRICSRHFPEGKTKRPTRFHWNEHRDFDLLGLNPNVRTSSKKLSTKASLTTGTFLEEVPVPEVYDGYRSEQDEALSALEIKVEYLTRKLSEEKTGRLNDAENFKLELNLLSKKLKHLEVELKFYKNFELEARDLRLVIQSHKNTKAPVSSTPNIRKSLAITYEDILNSDDDTRASFTGFRDISSIQFLNNIIQYKGIKYQKCEKVKCLTSEDQLILFLMKLRLDLPHFVLAKLFRMSIFSVSNIVNTHLHAVYELFYEGEGPMAKIPSRFQTASSLPKCFGDMRNCRIVIDCTEFFMQIPSNLQDKKFTFSSYKSKHTMKSLIGCAPNGTPVFVSDLFGGSESDKSIVMKSKLLDQMLPGDLILADKGFELFDILPPGVSLNIPSFLVTNQFTLNETLVNRSYARARIIIERLNARIKIFKILDCISANDRQKADRLVKVCVALTTLIATLMNELNCVEIM